MGATLLILAAGMASRYGSLKQIEQVGPSGETILDYSIYDAIKAGFDKIVFVIRPEIETEFNSVFMNKLKKHVEVEYVFQQLDMLPEGLKVPSNRVKPWGTSHAVLVAEKQIQTPFAVINADDYYGVSAYHQMFQYLSALGNDETSYAMIGYELQNTLSDFGSVTRGICKTDAHSQLCNIKEYLGISKTERGIFFKENNGEMSVLDNNPIVSMNFWGFTPAVFAQIRSIFKRFIVDNATNPTVEIYLPLVIDELISSKLSTVNVLTSHDQWFGVTYKEDKPQVVASINELVKAGEYPRRLWE